MSSPLPSWVKNVSRETLESLERYVALLQKWNPRINLVGKSTTHEIWERHIADSLQLISLIPSSALTAVDLGSGGGLPGIVIGTVKPDLAITLVEQDQRKAAFLREAAAQLGLSNVTVANKDLHTITERFDFITARALAPLPDLCAMAYGLANPGTVSLFPKGKNFAIELAEAQKNWRLVFELIPSKTSEDASIISISELSKTQA